MCVHSQTAPRGPKTATVIQTYPAAYKPPAGWPEKQMSDS